MSMAYAGSECPQPDSSDVGINWCQQSERSFHYSVDRMLFQNSSA